MSARDSRLDAGVKVKPKAAFLLGDDEWGGDKGILDVLDSRPAVDDSHNPPARPVRVDSLPAQPVPVQPSRSIGEVASVLAFGIVCFILGGLAVYAMHLMVVAS